MPNLSVFPNGGIDQFLKHYDALASDIPFLKRIRELQYKENKTPSENNELTNLISQYRDKLFLANDLNHLQDAIMNLQSFFLSSVDGYILNKQSEFNAYVNDKKNEIASEQTATIDTINATKTDAVNSISATKTTAENNIQSTKDAALISIEQKKENILNYMDSTTAGQIRNDIGIKNELATTDKSSLVAAINEVNAKEFIHIGTTPPSNTSLLWIDKN